LSGKSWAYKKVAEMTPAEHAEATEYWRQRDAVYKKRSTRGPKFSTTSSGYPSMAGKSWAKKNKAEMTASELADAQVYWKERSRINREKAAAKQVEVRHLPAPVEAPLPKPLQRGVIDPTDAALAVIESQVNGHGVPAHLLHDVVMYVDHTRELARKLRDG
jgi:hypothetical protein